MEKIKAMVREIPWTILLVASLFLGLAPFSPEPHLVEKFRMLIHGQLQRPIDVFDFLFHGAPLLVVIAKLIVGKKKQN